MYNRQKILFRFILCKFYIFKQSKILKRLSLFAFFFSNTVPSLARYYWINVYKINLSREEADGLNWNTPRNNFFRLKNRRSWQAKYRRPTRILNIILPLFISNSRHPSIETSNKARIPFCFGNSISSERTASKHGYIFKIFGVGPLELHSPLCCGNPVYSKGS